MLSIQLQFLLFILCIFILLILIALDIDFFNRLLSREKHWKLALTSHSKKTIGEISQQLNSYIQSESLARRSIQICPVEALTLTTDPKQNLMVSEKRCLGDACLECLKLIPSQSMKLT